MRARPRNLTLARPAEALIEPNTLDPLAAALPDRVAGVNDAASPVVAVLLDLPVLLRCPSMAMRGVIERLVSRSTKAVTSLELVGFDVRYIIDIFCDDVDLPNRFRQHIQWVIVRTSVCSKGFGNGSAEADQK